jgi:hypothetical protein
MRSTAAAARRRASTSAGSFTTRSGPVTSPPRVNAAPGRAAWRSRTNRAQVRSPTATRAAGPARPATMATGSSVSSHGRRENTSGRSTTLGASSRGTTSVASPSRGSTSIVSRSSGIAS